MKRFRLQASKPAPMVENDVERQCLDLLGLKGYRAERLHAGTFKSLDGRRFVKGHDKGTPDYIVAHPLYPAFYLEVKRPGKTPGPDQQQKHFELRLLGFEVVTADNLEAFAAWLYQRKAR